MGLVPFKEEISESVLSYLHPMLFFCLCLFPSVPLSLCLSFPLCVSLSLCLCLCPSIYLLISVSLLSLPLSTFVSLLLSVSLCLFPSPSLCLFPTLSLSTTKCRHREKAAVCKAGRELSLERLCWTLIIDFQPPEPREINVVLGHPVCTVWLQPEMTKTDKICITITPIF